MSDCPGGNGSVSAPRDHFVYRIFHHDGQLLYVGVSKNPSQRWKQHCNGRPGFNLVGARFKVQGPYTKTVALRMENAAHCTECPLLGQATRPASQRVAHLEAERLYSTLPHLVGPVMAWHRFEARPLEGFPGWWRAFSQGRPTAVMPQSEIDDGWYLKEDVA